MAKKLDDKEIVTFKGLVMATSIQADALAQLLIDAQVAWSGLSAGSLLSTGESSFVFSCS